MEHRGIQVASPKYTPNFRGVDECWTKFTIRRHQVNIIIVLLTHEGGPPDDERTGPHNPPTGTQHGTHERRSTVCVSRICTHSLTTCVLLCYSFAGIDSRLVIQAVYISHSPPPPPLWLGCYGWALRRDVRCRRVALAVWFCVYSAARQSTVRPPHSH